MTETYWINYWTLSSRAERWCAPACRSGDGGNRWTGSRVPQRCPPSPTRTAAGSPRTRKTWQDWPAIPEQPSHLQRSGNIRHKNSINNKRNDSMTRTVRPCELIDGLGVPHALDVTVSDDRDGNTVLDGLNGVVVNGLVSLISGTTVNCNPRDSCCLHLLTEIHRRPDILVNSGTSHIYLFSHLADAFIQTTYKWGHYRSNQTNKEQVL